MYKQEKYKMNSEKVTGIIGAMPEEVELLKQKMEGTDVKSAAGMDFYVGMLEGKKTVVVQSGIGKVNAGICAQLLISSFGAGQVINTGVAGSLDNRIDIGDIVVSTDAVQHDYDVSPIGFKKGEIPYTGIAAFPADEKLRKIAADAVRKAASGKNVFEGRVCSGDQFISTGDQKNRIISEFSGMCCEMEGAAIAQVCYLNKVPFVIIRAISDKADESEGSMSYEQFEEEEARNCSQIICQMLKNM